MTKKTSTLIIIPKDEDFDHIGKKIEYLESINQSYFIVNETLELENYFKPNFIEIIKIRSLE